MLIFLNSILKGCSLQYFNINICWYVLSWQVAEYLSDPLCRGIYAGDARLLSLKSCFPPIYQYEHQHGSLVKGVMLSREGDGKLI